MNTEAITARAQKTPAQRAGLDERTWAQLIKRIKEGRCTPVIGSGACTAPPIGCGGCRSGRLPGYPTKEDISLGLAKKVRLPLDDQRKLERVAKYITGATEIYDVMVPKEAFANRFKDLQPPNFGACASEPHRMLAELPFAFYLTSNFDDWMFRALQFARRDPHLALCRWNQHIAEEVPDYDPEFEYTVANPLVYHFHGCTPWGGIGRRDGGRFLRVPDQHLQGRHQTGPLGETRDEWSPALPRLHSVRLGFSCPLPPLCHQAAGKSDHAYRRAARGPTDTPGSQTQKTRKAIDYLNSYFGNAKIRIYWGTCQQFCHDLRLRWEAAEEKK